MTSVEQVAVGSAATLTMSRSRSPSLLAKAVSLGKKSTVVMDEVGVAIEVPDVNAVASGLRHFVKQVVGVGASRQLVSMAVTL
jgi:hypothetical protein